MDVPALTWSPYMHLGEMTLNEARTYAAANSMRLPTIYELLVLQMKEKRVFGESRDRAPYWSSTSASRIPNSVWLVFPDGEIHDGGCADDRNAVRFVMLTSSQ